MLMKASTFALALLAATALPAAAQDAVSPVVPKPGHAATLQNAEGRNIGTVKVTGAPKGVLVSVDASNLPSGWHAFHFHKTGDCDDHADHFKKSGPHAAREGEEHGFFSEKGPHLGDFANFFVGADGSAKFEQFSQNVKAEDLMDADGTAAMIHASPDDYASQPAGDAGERLACGVIQKAE
jgi:Cu-Zn family superoxide dismutase